MTADDHLRSSMRRLAISRTLAALCLFIAWPLSHTAIPRATPAFVGLALLFLLAGQASTLWRYANWQVIPFVGRPVSPLAVTVLAYAGWMAVSLLWSPSPEAGAKDVAALIVVLLLLPVVIDEFSALPKISLMQMVLLGLAISIAFLLLEMTGVTSIHRLLIGSNMLFDLNRNAAWILLITCALSPHLAASGRSGLVWIVLWILAALAVFWSESEATKIAFAGAVLIGLIARFSPRMIRPVFWIMAATIVVMPFVVHQVPSQSIDSPSGLLKQASAAHRLSLWQGYSDLVQERPVIGHGAKADRGLGESGAATAIAVARGFPKSTTSPHNAALEIWVNQGLIGALLAAAIVVLAGRFCMRQDSATRLANCQCITAAFCISLTGSSLYQGWWLATVFVALALANSLGDYRMTLGGKRFGD